MSPMRDDRTQIFLTQTYTQFNVDSVRVVKIMGGGLSQSRVIRGMVFGREPEGKLLFLAVALVNTRLTQRSFLDRYGPQGEQRQGRRLHVRHRHRADGD